MLRRLTIGTALAVAMSIAAALTLATPALAKGPTQARITGPGLAHAIVVSGHGEATDSASTLGTLAWQTGLFAVLFGPSGDIPAPARLAAAPRAGTLGPRYALSYTVPGVTPSPPSAMAGHIRQYLYPWAAGGPVIYTPPGQQGFNGGTVQAAGWFRGRPPLARVLAQAGLPSRPRALAAQARLSAAAGPGTPAWLIALAAVLAVAALSGAALWLRRRKPPAMAAGLPARQRH
jgi:hypothetical protein